MFHSLPRHRLLARRPNAEDLSRRLRRVRAAEMISTIRQRHHVAMLILLLMMVLVRRLLLLLLAVKRSFIVLKK